MHNPRGAEAAKEAGCSHDEFLDFMRQDDALDADLTKIGEHQARTVGSKCAWDLLQLVVSSPLSRALHTADLIAPASQAKGVSVGDFHTICLVITTIRPPSVFSARFHCQPCHSIHRPSQWRSQPHSMNGTPGPPTSNNPLHPLICNNNKKQNDHTIPK